MFKLNPLFLSLVAAQGLLFPILNASAALLKPYTPEFNDNKAGVYCLCNGTTQTLSGLPQFAPGVSGATRITLGELQNTGRIINDNLIGEKRLDLGLQNFTVRIPDFEAHTSTYYDVYDTFAFNDLLSVSGAAQVPDYYDVKDGQYINARVAAVSNGTLNIAIGKQGAASSASTNRWSMAAKQSELFTAKKQGHLNWDANNRITFTAATPPYSGDRLAYNVGNVVDYGGAFTVTTKDGAVNAFNVTNSTELRNYNDWLVLQLRSANLRAEDYNPEFSKAYALREGSVVYRMSTNNLDDEVAQPLGDQVVLSADGPNASVKINRGKTLEVKNNSTAVMRASNGARAIINGKLASSGPVQSESKALELINGSTGVNNGVINGGFFNNANGEGVDNRTLGYIGKVVASSYGSQFTNNGVINFALSDAPVSGGSSAIWLGNGHAINHGNINVGVANVGNGSSAAGVSFSGEGSFINAEDGTLYIGRTPQNRKTDATQDVEVYLNDGVFGIDQILNASAINNGRIVVGSKVQNAVGMRVRFGPDALALNNGVIDLNGRAESQPAENVGMLVVDSGSSGRVGNTGTINVNGDSTTAIKVIASEGNRASAFSTGTINVNAHVNVYDGTFDTAVWVKGEPGGQAKADLSGPINLNGDSVIGIRAEGDATVNVTSNALPQQSSGQYQITFYALGPDAKINLPANSSFTTPGWSSVLFRYQDGADFDGHGLTLTPDDFSAIGVMGSGKGTTINTNGATFNIGQIATGVLVEGGAQGTIDANTTFNMVGETARAAAVDGKTRNLLGEYSDPDAPPVANTLLVNHADIQGSADWQTGLQAWNQAQLVNTGNITFAGQGTYGIEAYSGATVTNSGDISVTRGGTGLYAYNYPLDGDGVTPSVINNSGTLNVSAGESILVSPTYGAVAYYPLSRINQNGIINLYGDDVIGAEAVLGATLNLGPDSRVVFHSPNQTAYQAMDIGSRLFSGGGTTDVSTEGSTLYRISAGAFFSTFSAANVTLSGANSTGIVASGLGTNIFGTDVFTVTGNGATAVRVSDNAEGVVTNPITLNGRNSTAVVSVGNESTVYAASDIVGGGETITAFEVSNAARLFNQYQGRVNLTGPDSTGARVHDGGNFINRGSVHVASGIGVDVSSGYGQYVPMDSELRVDDGIAALRVGSGAELKIYGDGQGSSTLSANGSADGLLLDSGAQRFEANDIILGAYGSGSAINNRAETASIFLQNVRLESGRGAAIRSATSFDPDGSALINVGSGGTGYLFANEDGSTTSNDLLIGQGYSIVVPGEGTGVQANTSGRVVTQGSIDIQAANGGSAIVTRTASEVINQGSISSLSLRSPIIDLRGGETVFINEGIITAPNPETVVIAGGATDDLIALLDGKVLGDVDTGNGRDSLILTGGTINGSLTMGNGTNNSATIEKVSLADTRHITTQGGAGSTLNLSEITARGGSFSNDDLSKGTNLGAGWSTLNFYNTQWTLTDNIKLAHSTINIDSGSTLFVGDGVNPLLQGATDDSLVVNNAGTLDLTNGANVANNTLTLDGELVSNGGSLRLNSFNTQSDALRVNGNVSGTTFIDDTLIGGTVADTNGDSTITATEGISLAQVSGSASRTSFALKQGYVASGPWQYSVYSFAPGSSDASQREVSGSGNAFWDYRLANTFVCEDGSLCQPQAGSGKVAARPAVTPQMPSYISAPVGLAYYTLAITDDLHKRLGELRYQQNNPDALGGEMFIRYIGSNLEYQSNRGFSDYGYDFDLDYSAVQLGGNLLRLDGAQDSLRGGIAYTRGNSRIRPHAADGYSSTSFDSDSLALYGTWQRDSGFYVDGSLAWSWYRGETDIARQKEVASPKGKGWAASLESGYPFEFAHGVRFEPQAQLTWLRLNMENFTDSDRTRVSYDDYDQTIGRLGARLARTWQDDSQRLYTPYLRANYFRGWGGTAKVNIGSTGSDINQNFDSGKFGQMWDVGIGGSASLKRDVSFYAEADYRKEIDGNGAKGWRYNAGVRWSF